jgi:serine/threonine-protein kinase
MNLQIGSTIGDYQVVGILGAGGMGKVYKVRNVISDRVEAMKVLLPDLATEAGLADRFLREIKLLASMEHPNIAALHTAVRVDNQLLMLMEFVEGVTLDQRLRDGGPLAAQQAVDYISQALSALEYAHAHGVIHRDIKPANMIVTPGGVVKLMDFGIAKGAADNRLTQTGATLGSLYYMSPEQIQGAADLDRRSDLYSVGVTLYELVTGKRPFDGDSQFAIMAAHLEKTPVPPITVDPGLPQALNDVILLSVAKDPNARFQTAGAFRNALASVFPERAAAAPAPAPIVAPAPVQAAGIVQPRKPASSGSKRGLWMALGAVAAVLAVAAAIEFGPWHGSKAAPRPDAASAPAIVTPAPEVSTAPASEPVAQPPLQEPEPSGDRQSRPPANAARIPKSPVGAATPVESMAGGPPEQQAPPPVRQPQPAPVPQAPPPAAARPAESGPSRAELQAAREQLVMLDTRAGSVQTGMQGFERSQAASGLNLRADMQQARSLMNAYLKGATDAFNANDLASAKSFMDKAEAQIDKLENFLGH